MENQSILSDEKKKALYECAKWARILAILIFSITGFFFLSVIITGFNNPVSMFSSIIILLIISSFYIAFGVLLFYFHKHARTALLNSDNYTMDRALYNYKWFFALNGIIIIIGISLYCLILLILRLAV